MRVGSHNEWDLLEEVVVGNVLGAMYPEVNPILLAHGEPSWLWHFQGEFIEDEIVAGAAEQLENFVAVLEREGVVVQRPDPHPHNIAIETPYWRAKSGWNSANPRDLFLVVGDDIIECASPMRYRHFESLAYRRLFNSYFREGAKLSCAPKPMLRDSLFRHIEPADEEDAHKTLAPGEKHQYPIGEDEPLFEAADFVRCGRDIFCTRSIVTNALGIEWVRRHIGADYRVHELQTRCRVPWHIDTTFVPLCPGKALVHPHWLQDVPEILQSWELRPAPIPTYRSDSPMAHSYFTSQWLSMNMLSLDEKRVIVDDQQLDLIRMLEGWGFSPIAVPFDHMGTFGGSFHCATLDIRRRGKLQSYFHE